VIGGKLLVDWGFNTVENPHRINFHDYTHVEFWVFWLLMLGCFAVGFLPRRSHGQHGQNSTMDTADKTDKEQSPP
jgi:hypothetical protein